MIRIMVLERARNFRDCFAVIQLLSGNYQFRSWKHSRAVSPVESIRHDCREEVIYCPPKYTSLLSPQFQSLGVLESDC